jgi:hypothetical protein
MAERWLCKRCFTSADPIESACPNCGLPRGAAAPLLAGEVPEPEETLPGEYASQLPEGDTPPDKAPTTPASGWGLIGLGGILLLVEVVRRMNRPADDG